MNSKKPDEHITDKFRQAAEQFQPAFDEKAWAGMEALLDKEERKKRPLFWWWLLPVLLLVAIGGYWVSQSSPAEKTTAAANAATAPVQPVTGTDKNNTAAAELTHSSNAAPPQPVSAASSTTAVAVDDLSSKKLPVSIQTTASVPIAVAGQRPVINNAISKRSAHKIQKRTRGKVKYQSAAPDADSMGDEPVSSNSMPDQVATKEPVNTTPQKENTSSIVEPAKKDTVAVAEKKLTADTVVAKKETKKSGKNRRLYVFATGGTDAGSVRLFNYKNSSITPKFGIGVGYQFCPQISVQTGFYLSNKKYIAGAGDYHTKAGTYWNQVQIQKVEAACMIYEIPVSLRFNLLQKTNYMLFGTIGSSSYIMHHEDYNYYYTRNNVEHESYWQYRGNRHFASELNFSFGIEKRLSPAFGLLAEPSFSLPVSGVGDGKVKLYSSSLQVGLIWHPVKK